ncbi:MULTISPECIES: transcriptional regulator-like protein [Nitrosopumilus]|nr:MULTISPECIES: transcriptional regulator-like protein [Nitrosopumilus]
MLQNTSEKIDNLISKKIQGIDFLANNELYFSSHNFGDVPDYLLSQIEAFSSCRVLSSVWSSHSYCQKIISDSEKFVYCIFTQPPFLLADIFYQKLQSGTPLKFLFGKNSDIPECNDLVDKLQLDKPKLDTQLKKRMCDHVAANLIMSDSGACLMLPDNNNATDMVMGIAGNEKPFLDWCVSFFEYKWNTGEMFARLR